MAQGRFQKVVWSPVEIAYLKRNKDNKTRQQLCIALSKSLTAIRTKIQELNGEYLPADKKTVRQGIRKDLGIYLRSSWEANVARWLNYQGLMWIYEPKVFYFEGIKSGTMTYCPDFYLPRDDIWLEVKGQMIPEARTAIRRFKKFFPEEFCKLRAITGSLKTQATKFFRDPKIQVPIMAYYNELKREFQDIVPGWE